MKLLIMCCESGLDEKATDVLDDLGAPGYTVCRQALGKGKTGMKHNNPIWPGCNSVVHACVPDEMVPEIIDRVRQARDEYVKTPGCCILQVDAVRVL